MASYALHAGTRIVQVIDPSVTPPFRLRRVDAGANEFEGLYPTFDANGNVDFVSAPAAVIADGSITYAKIQNVSATDKLLGRSTSGAGVVEEIACTAAGRNLLDDADAAAQRTTLGLGTMATQADSAVAIAGGTVAGLTSLGVSGSATIGTTLGVTGSATFSSYAIFTGPTRLTPPSATTISGGSVAITKTWTVLDTEGAAATDDLVTATGGFNGDVLILSTTNNGRDVVVKHGTSADQFRLVGAADFTLTTVFSTIEFLKIAGVWCEQRRATA